jgi:tRNA pseudouridine38-40 synthase
VEAPEHVRLALTVHYDGSAFHGWQLQPDQRTVQGVLEETLSRLADRPVRVLGAGRTDAGVHATGQVVSTDLPAAWSPEKLERALNAVLPDDVWIEAVRGVGPDFHPRYDAVARTYTYHVGVSPRAASPFYRRWCWPLCEELDEPLLAVAASHLFGKHSFEAFSKAGQPERGVECTIREAAWSAWELGSLFTITADRYLHHMVRYLVGTMVDIGRGRRPASDLPRLLVGSVGLTTSAPAPAPGLFLTHVEYPDNVLLGTRPSVPPSRSAAPV